MLIATTAQSIESASGERKELGLALMIENLA